MDARAQRLDPKLAPEPLRPWTEWVLAGKEETLCPSVQGSPDLVHCAWPTALSLTLGEKGGRFEQHWHLDAREWIPLPGDGVRWPLEVAEGGKKLVVVDHDSVPSVQLVPGDHTITGDFAWDSLPDSLQVHRRRASCRSCLAVRASASHAVTKPGGSSCKRPRRRPRETGSRSSCTAA